MMASKTSKTKRGGKRAGAGRKPRYDSPMVSVRIPESMKDAILTMRDMTHQHIPYHLYPAEALLPADTLLRQSAPLYSSKVAAGFPSAADDYVDKRMDLNEYFMQHPGSTFFVVAIGDSMDRAGILPGTFLQVDKALDVRNHDIVVATVDREFTVKRYHINPKGGTELRPESSNPIHQPILCTPERDIVIWGVVCGIHQKLR